MTANIDRRAMLRLAAALGAATTVAACDRSSAKKPSSSANAPAVIAPHDAAITQEEAHRPHSARPPRVFALAATPTTLDLGGQLARTWSYGPDAGTQLVRAGVGDTIQATLANGLPDTSTLHWHGIEIRNDMDGVAPMTQAAVAPGAQFPYAFDVAKPGTYWYHSHVGLQADRALYGPLVVDDNTQDPEVAVDEVIVIDDWIDGLGATPEDVLMALNPRLGGPMAGKSMPAASSDGSASESSSPVNVNPVAKAMVRTRPQNSTVLKGMGGVIDYPLHLINGRPPNDQRTILATTGMRVRLRVINAGAETPYRFAVGGHRITVTHTDGQAVEPFEVDTLVIGMAERYDVELTVQSGAWPIVAVGEGKPGYAAAVLRTRDASATAAPGSDARPSQLNGQMLSYADLTPAAEVRLVEKAPDRQFKVDLVGDMSRYVWGIAGRDAARLQVRQGERISIAMTNTTDMWHPMHLHGHTFAVDNANGIRKDTVIVLPKQTVTIQFDATNPGQWMFHCHNAYHMEAGMTTNLYYLA